MPRSLVLLGCLTLAACACPERAPLCPTTVPTPGPAATSEPAPAAGLGDTDEGMWLLNEFPAERLVRLHGFAPTQAWLDHVRESSIRLAGGCSGSLVSSRGLVLTNHHCAEKCIQQLSTKQKDLTEAGFYAASAADEARCPDMEVNQLTAIEDVTDRMQEALAGASAEEFATRRKAAVASLEQACTTSDAVRCDVVDLYRGGKYHLYKYRRFQDVRLVFAPEVAIAFFGGDPDNFMFPRFDLDVSFLRIYDGGTPLASSRHFAWSAAGAAEGELTFIAGHPGSTERSLTVSQLAYRRDVRLPERLLWWSEERGLLTEWSQRGEDQRRLARSLLFKRENAIKAYKGRLAALVDPAFFARKVAEERALRARVAADPALAASVAGAWDAIETAQAARRRLHHHYELVEEREGLESTLFSIARALLRGPEELAKPNAARLHEFGDANLPALKQALFSSAPVSAELETLTLGASLVHRREVLGPDDALVKKLLGTEEPRELARRLVAGTKLADPKVRQALWDGGKAAVDASQDPFIELARRIDGEARAYRQSFEHEVEGVETRNGELIARARFLAFGTAQYPDATFTLRLSYGVVKGWSDAGRVVAPFTTLGGAFERATGKEPFALPQSWLGARSKLALDTPFDFVTTNDLIGGNSGSPVFNAKAEIVGVVFDGNIHSLGGAFGFDDQKNRAVAVHSRALVEALAKIYGAGRLVEELGK
ncbi:MAG: S46 family peptidase [Myxococcales bacterium]|nr:S46 family peptidase [Myxococcales bacterium]